MRREVDQFIDYAESKGVGTVLWVNPIAFTDRVIDQLLDSVPTQLFITLDGHEDKSFFATRGVEKAWERFRDTLFKNLERKEINEFKDRQLNVLKKQDVRKSDGSCNRPWKTLTVTWNGDAIPRCHDYDKKESLGNIHAAMLQAIWNGEPMRRLREQFVTGRIEITLRRNCEKLRTIL